MHDAMLDAQKQTKTQARFLDTLSGAFETHFLPLRKKYMEYVRTQGHGWWTVRACVCVCVCVCVCARAR